MPNYAWNTLYIKKGDFDKFVKGPDEDCCIRFTTAWGAPDKWLLELARNCDFRLDCEVEGCDDRYRYIGEDQTLHILKTEFTEVDVWE